MLREGGRGGLIEWISWKAKGRAEMRAVKEMVKVFSAFTTDLTSTHESFRSLSCKLYFDFFISSSRV